MSRMPKRVCRLRLQPGQPVSLSIYPQTTFLDLPLEIRDKIYQLCLVASRPITVWSGSREYPCQQDDRADGGRLVIRETYIIEPRDPVLDTLTKNLFYCTAIVGREAVAAFYTLNTFHVTGWEVWSPLYFWLGKIGKTNRGYLRKLTVDLPAPDMEIVDEFGEYGIRTGHVSRAYTQVYSVTGPGHPQWYRWKVGPLHCAIDPAIKACFLILGNSGPQLDLSLHLKTYVLPGANISDYEHPCENISIANSMCIPNEVEHARRAHASRVNIVWKGESPKKHFETQKEFLVDAGWEVQEEEEAMWPRERESYTDHAGQIMWHAQCPTICFSLRRKELTILD